MAAYQIQINERTAKGKYILEMLRAAPDAVSFNETAVLQALQCSTKPHKNLQRAFRNVREIMDGKQKRVSIDEFVNELRNNND